MRKSVRLVLLLAVSALLGHSAAAQWLRQDTHLPLYSGIRDIAAVSSTVAWAVGYDSTAVNVPYHHFIRTITGGATWTSGVVTGASNYSFANIDAISDQTAWVTMNDNTNGGGAIFHTAFTR